MKTFFLSKIIIALMLLQIPAHAERYVAWPDYAQDSEHLEIVLKKIYPGTMIFSSQFEFTIKVSGITDSENNFFVLKPLNWNEAVTVEAREYSFPEIKFILPISELKDVVENKLESDPKGYQLVIAGKERRKLFDYDLGETTIWLDFLNFSRDLNRTSKIYDEVKISDYKYLFDTDFDFSESAFWSSCYSNSPSLRCFFMPKDISISDPRSTFSRMEFGFRLIPDSYE